MYHVIFFTDITETVPVYKYIGAYKLAYELRQRGYRCLVVDRLHTFTTDELKKILDQTVDESTLFIGFSTTFLNNSNVERKVGQPLTFTPLTNDTFLPQGRDSETELVEYAKKLNKNIKIVIGGTKAHANITNKNIDYAIIGYGESAVLNLVNNLSNQNFNTGVKNLWGIRIIDDKNANTGYDFASSHMVWEASDVLNFKVLPFEVARGCIFKCKFCSYTMNGKQNLDFIRTTDSLIYELEKNYYEHNVSTYMILDDTFNDNQTKLLTLLHAIKKLKFQPKFWAHCRLDLIAKNPSTMDILYDIGLRGTQFGIETLNRKSGLIIGKGYDRKKQIDTINKLRLKYDNKISMHGNFIIGLPEENESSNYKTFSMLMSGEIPLHSWRFHGLVIAKNDRVSWNSEFGIDYKKYGYEETTVNAESIYINWKNKFMDSERAKEIMKEFNDCSYASENYYVPNILGWGLLELGFDIDKITSTKYRDINFHAFEKSKDKFNLTHKQELFKLLKIN
jgi:radical SAM superfamily enzyme YgiQ (UPF0313 family)